MFKLLADFSLSPKTRRSEVCLPIGSDMRTTLPVSGARIKMNPLDILTGHNPPGNKERPATLCLAFYCVDLRGIKGL